MASTVFAIVVASLMALFNYVLKINRRTEALRQATQGMRSVVEFLTKEIRNGQIDYSVAGGKVVNSIFPCPQPALYSPPAYNRNTAGNNVYGQFNTGDDNRLGIVTVDGDRECIFYATATGTPIDVNDSSGSAFHSGTQLMIAKNDQPAQSINPANFVVKQALFRVRPLEDPYTTAGYSPKIQPSVSMYFEFVAVLPTGEQFPIYYQTTVSSDKYDVPTEDLP